MSFYLVMSAQNVEDARRVDGLSLDDFNGNSKDFVWMCGWEWYDLGRAFGNRGVSLEDDGSFYKMSVGVLKDFADAMYKISQDPYFQEIERVYQSSDDYEFNDYFWDELYPNDVDIYDFDIEKYNCITNPEVAKAMYAAELEYREKKNKENQVKRVAFKNWLSVELEGVNEWVREEAMELLIGKDFCRVVNLGCMVHKAIEVLGPDYEIDLTLG